MYTGTFSDYAAHLRKTTYGGFTPESWISSDDVARIPSPTRLTRRCQTFAHAPKPCPTTGRQGSIANDVGSVGL
jgi:hypothetical protein